MALATSFPLRTVCAGWIAPLSLVLTITAVALDIGDHAPVLGAPVTGVILGVMASPLARRYPRWRSVIDVVSRTPLQIAIVLLGASLSLTQVARVGWASLPVMLGTLAACLAGAVLWGRILGIPRDLRILIGAGTGICGASAIAAVAPTIRAKAPDITYAITTIFAFNIAAVVTFPLLGHLLGMSQHSFGLFAGTAVNDTSSVIATATIYGAAAAQYAVVVKLARSLMIIPLTVCLGVGTRDHDEPRRPHGILHLVPWFLIGFLIVAGLHTAQVIPASATHPLAWLTTALITVSMTAIGLQTDPEAMRRTGYRPLLFGALLWVTVAGTSLALQAALPAL